MAPTCKGRVAILLIASLLLVLGGCAVTPPGERAPGPQDQLVGQAEAALASGDKTTAAELLEEAARLAPSPARERLFLRAARLYAQIDRAARAKVLLGHVTGSQPAPIPALRRLVRAELALAEGDGKAALDHLQPAPASLPDDLHADYLDTLARVKLGLGEALEAARLFARRSELLAAPLARADNRRRLWQAMLAVPMETLRQQVPPLRPDRFGGWLELAYVVRTNRLDATATATGVAAWRERYPHHPAADRFSRTLVEQAGAALKPPERVALMLPLSGELGEIGAAVRQGFLAAYYAAPPEERPVLRVYDLGKGGVGSLAAYRDAVESGVNLVVGPLTKPALEQLAGWDDLPVPVLALNTLEQTPQQLASLYQFGLAPEDDAHAAAALAMRRGHRRAVVMTPLGEWGSRVAAAFIERYRALGGTVLETARYDASASDFGTTLRALFNLDASERRYRELRRVTRRDIAYTPRRRQDMEAIFIAAFPREARLIRPQVRFHRGIGLPVYATSHIWTGQNDPINNQDMDDIVFVDIPWLLGGAEAAPIQQAHRLSARVWPEATARLPRLHALGVDAYRLAGVVDVLALEPGMSIPGATGELSVGPRGRVHRAPRGAQFRDGQVRPLTTPTTPPSTIPTAPPPPTPATRPLTAPAAPLAAPESQPLAAPAPPADTPVR